MAEAIRDGLRLEAIAADIAGDGDTALELLSINAYDIAVLDRDIAGPSGDEIARRIVDCGSGMPILMLTAADRRRAPRHGATTCRGPGSGGPGDAAQCGQVRRAAWTGLIEPLARHQTARLG